jgi:RHS repeat-associated protein
VVHYSFTDDLLDAGYKIDIQGGNVFERELSRDIYLRDSVVSVTNRHGGTVRGWSYSYDALQRPVSRNDNEFNYNERGEIVFSRRDAEDAENTYLYDGIGNLNSYEIVGVGTNSFSVNNRNQYLTICENSAFSASLRETNLKYDSNGNLTKFGDWSYVYDSGSRLVSVSSNNMVVATFAYDTQGRRVKKVAADETHRYFYDGQLLVYEHITRPDNTVSEIDYIWGNDISGTRDGACGIGGLLYLKRNGVVYIPFFDAYGNVLGYTDAHGNVEAEYTYDPFGNIVGKSGAKSDDFAFRFSTKYYDIELDLYYYTYRYYNPQLMRWLTEDPIAEDGGLNLYGFCGNNPVSRYDKDGRAYFAVRGLGPIPTPLKWSDFMSGLRSAMCPFAYFTQQERDAIDKAADLSNFEILHEQLFFEDGGIPNSIGWGKNENGIGYYIENETNERYETKDDGYDDCIMRIAVSKVNPQHYQLSKLGSKTKCNCQDYADALRAMYRKLENDQKIKCGCKKGKTR